MRPRNLAEAATVGLTLARGTIVELPDDGTILVATTSDPPLRLLCDFLKNADTAGLTLRVGQQVLVVVPDSLDERGCVVGRIGAYEPPEPAAPPDTKHVVVEADQDLVLKCGDASVTLNRQGKILVKAVDIVSRAKRNQRIKGGSVQIN